MLYHLSPPCLAFSVTSTTYSSPVSYTSSPSLFMHTFVFVFYSSLIYSSTPTSSSRPNLFPFQFHPYLLFTTQSLPLPSTSSSHRLLSVPLRPPISPHAPPSPAYPLPSCPFFARCIFVSQSYLPFSNIPPPTDILLHPYDRPFRYHTIRDGSWALLISLCASCPRSLNDMSAIPRAPLPIDTTPPPPPTHYFHLAPRRLLRSWTKDHIVLASSSSAAVFLARCMPCLDKLKPGISDIGIGNGILPIRYPRLVRPRRSCRYFSSLFNAASCLVGTTSLFCLGTRRCARGFQEAEGRREDGFGTARGRGEGRVICV
ncbi:hypothetical protein R3P38DRAFT_600849 [Favolaschia claudopus]|uniref:Uncharacterized protein n=1 Tax=Favolaschia claudopus TaxID=2862362 RepID=A0AAV9Z7A1_9AGAR